MAKTVHFYQVVRQGKVASRKQLPFDIFNERYSPDHSLTFNPPRGAMPYTYYLNKRSGKRFMVAALLVVTEGAVDCD